MKLTHQNTQHSQQASSAILARIRDEIRSEKEAVGEASPLRDRVTLSDDDFLSKRREAAIAQLLKDSPEANEERDALLLRILGRECRNSDEMASYRHLLHSSDSKCEEKMYYYNGVAPSTHPHNGKNFDDLGDYLDKVEPVLSVIQEMALPLPSEYYTLHRRTKEHHKAAETADGKFTFDELYTRGFPHFISAIYASDSPEGLEKFGPAKETLSLNPDATYLDAVWPDFQSLAMQSLGLSGTIPMYDLYYKAGVDVCLYKEVAEAGDSGWLNIYNPEVIESVT